MVQQATEESGERFGVITRVAASSASASNRSGPGSGRPRSTAACGQGPAARTKSGSPCWNARCGSCAGPRRSCRRRRRSLWPSSTAGVRDDPLHRCHHDRFGVEPICRTLQVAPSSYSAATRRQPSARAVGDAVLARRSCRCGPTTTRSTVPARSGGSCTVKGEGGRDRVARLLRGLGIAGAVRGKTRRTTIADPTAARAPDLVQRRFVATRPSQLWGIGFT